MVFDHDNLTSEQIHNLKPQLRKSVLYCLINWLLMVSKSIGIEFGVSDYKDMVVYYSHRI